MSKTCWPDTLRRACLAVLLAGAGTTMAAPAAVEPFGVDTWSSISGAVHKPIAVVFTATYCANCPEAVDALVRAARARGLDATVVAVVIDAAPGDARLLQHAHYRSADRLFAFAAPAARLQHGVNPRWRGITPSVALLAPGVKPQWVTGVPAAEQLAAWGR